VNVTDRHTKALICIGLREGDEKAQMNVWLLLWSTEHMLEFGMKKRVTMGSQILAKMYPVKADSHIA